MSWEASGFVRRLCKTPGGRVFTHAEKLLLLVLADRHNIDEDMAWPTIEALAHDALMSKRWAMTCIARLQAEGVLEVISAGKTGQGWRLHGFRFIGLDATKVVNSVHHVPAEEGVDVVKVVNPLHHVEGGEGGELGDKNVVKLSSPPSPPIPPLTHAEQPTKNRQGGARVPRAAASPPPPPAAPGAAERKRAAGESAAVTKAQARREALTAWLDARGWLAQWWSDCGTGQRWGAPDLPPRLQRALDTVGRKRIVFADERELGFCRREFLEAYELLAEPP